MIFLIGLLVGALLASVTLALAVGLSVVSAMQDFKEEE